MSRSQPESSGTDSETPLVTRMEGASTADQPRMRRLPHDVLEDAARRLRVIALIFAVGAGVVVLLGLALDPVERQRYTHAYVWGPVAVEIAAALAMFGLASIRRMPAPVLMNIGLVFEVVIAYCIAASTYWGVFPGLAHEPEHLTVFGLSYVSPWILFFTIVAPNDPRKALVAAAAAGSSVPLMVLLSVRFGGTSIEPTAAFVAGKLIVPWALIVVTAYVGARVVYKLGTAVTRAREMGSYRLTQRLGGGGMGEVWRAKHRMLARPAAIKLIRPDKLRGDDREGQLALQHRFEREAQATALMHSPHTIDVYDFGVTADGTFYYVMELLNGFDLKTLVERFGPVSSERTVYLLRQVCDSLMEAHENDLIHRDVKPANIYLCQQGRLVDFVKVLDFGLVKPQRERGPDSLRLTGKEVAQGTPAFMAPEQACGEPVDGRTDLYALGCVAYWLVTGQLVFSGRTPMEMMAHHLQTRPLPPSQLSEQPIPDDFEEVLLSCLEKDPSRRPQNAADLDAALANCGRDGQWTPDRARTWWAQHDPTAAGGWEMSGERIRVL